MATIRRNVPNRHIKLGEDANAYNEVHYERPIRVGDDLVVEVMFTDVFEKSGRAGTLLFRTRTTRYLDLTRTGR